MSDILNELYAVLQSRKNEAVDQSYTASLYAGGAEKISRKITEEASEVLIDAIKGDTDNVINESADLLFHMMVLWAHMDIKPDDILGILKSRMGTSGHAEKASRSS